MVIQATLQLHIDLGLLQCHCSTNSPPNNGKDLETHICIYKYIYIYLKRYVYIYIYIYMYI